MMVILTVIFVILGLTFNPVVLTNNESLVLDYNNQTEINEPIVDVASVIVNKFNNNLSSVRILC